jgi:uncharacterized membrane protein
VIALTVAAIAFFSARGFSGETRSILAWNAFAGATLVMTWLRMLLADARTSIREARLQDPNRTAIFLFIVIAAIFSLLAVALLLKSANGTGPRAASIVALAGGTVVVSWFLVHTIFAVHYAHLYYGQHGRSERKQAVNGGLDFPGDDAPGFLDFAYFSFVIGMTCQVSDVQITSRRMRRLALCQGLLAFLFNAIILALSVNLASTGLMH